MSRPSNRYWPAVGPSSRPRIFMSVDLPDPEAPTIATNSPRSIRSETSASARTVSPVGRLYVLSSCSSSIIDGILLLHVTNQDLVAFAQTILDFPVRVVSAARRHGPALDRLAALGEDERPVAFATYRPDRHHQDVPPQIESDAYGGGHFRTERSVARRVESDHGHVVHDVVAN